MYWLETMEGNSFYTEFILNTKPNTNEKPEAHGPECTAMKAIFSQNTVCMQEKSTFRLPWQLIKFSSLDLIHVVVRGLLKQHYCKAFVKIPNIRQK